MLRSRAAVAAALAVGSLATGCGSSSVEGKAQRSAWGHYTWPNDVSIEVTTGRPCKPGPNAYPSDVRFGAIVSIRVSNQGDGDYRLRDMVPSSADRGEGASRLLDDPDGPCDTPLLPDKQIKPGEVFVLRSAYTVPHADGKMTLVLSPNYESEPIAFSGTVPVTQGA